MVLPQACASDYTLPSRVDSVRLYIPSGVDSTWCISPAEAAAPQSSMLDRGFQSQIDNLFPGSITSVPYRCLPPCWVISRRLWLPEPLSLSPTTGFQWHSLPSQSLGISLSSEHRAAGHFPNRIPCFGLAFSPAFRIPAYRIILHCILPNRVAFPFSRSITPS
jgi:hypothetical protein